MKKCPSCGSKKYTEGPVGRRCANCGYENKAHNKKLSGFLKRKKKKKNGDKRIKK